MGVALKDSILMYINHRNDSIARASREAAEYIILRHDVLYSPVVYVSFASISVVLTAYLIARLVVRYNGKGGE